MIEALIQKAVGLALKNDAGVDAIIAGRIFDKPRSASTSYPCITIGADDQIIDESDERHEMFRVAVVVHCWSRGRGLGEVKRLASAVRTALNGPITVAGFTCKVFDYRSTRFPSAGEAGTAHGVVEIEFLYEQDAA